MDSDNDSDTEMSSSQHSHSSQQSINHHILFEMVKNTFVQGFLCANGARVGPHLNTIILANETKEEELADTWTHSYDHSWNHRYNGMSLWNNSHNAYRQTNIQYALQLSVRFCPSPTHAWVWGHLVTNALSEWKRTNLHASITLDLLSLSNLLYSSSRVSPALLECSNVPVVDMKLFSHNSFVAMNEKDDIAKIEESQISKYLLIKDSSVCKANPFFDKRLILRNGIQQRLWIVQYSLHDWSDTLINRNNNKHKTAYEAGLTRHHFATDEEHTIFSRQLQKLDICRTEMKQASLRTFKEKSFMLIPTTETEDSDVKTSVKSTVKSSTPAVKSTDTKSTVKNTGTVSVYILSFTLFI